MGTLVELSAIPEQGATPTLEQQLYNVYLAAWTRTQVGGEDLLGFPRVHEPLANDRAILTAIAIAYGDALSQSGIDLDDDPDLWGRIDDAIVRQMRGARQVGSMLAFIKADPKPVP